MSRRSSSSAATESSICLGTVGADGALRLTVVKTPAMPAWGPRADVLLNTMLVIETYTLRRALTGLTQEEFDWEPHPGAWGIRRRADCTTPNATGTEGSEWVSDIDWALAEAADRGEASEPMTTIGWLLN